MTINANRLRLAQGGEISANTDGPGKGGNLTINVHRLELSDNSENCRARAARHEGTERKAASSSAAAAGCRQRRRPCWLLTPWMLDTFQAQQTARLPGQRSQLALLTRQKR